MLWFFHIRVRRNKIITDKHLMHVSSSTAVQFFPIFTKNFFLVRVNLYLDHKSTWTKVDLEFRSKNIILNRQTATKRYFESDFTTIEAVLIKYSLKIIYKRIKCIYFNNYFYKIKKESIILKNDNRESRFLCIWVYFNRIWFS